MKKAVIVTAALIAAAAAFLLWQRYFGADTPNTQNTIDPHDQSIYDALSLPQTQNNLVLAEITPENAKETLSQVAPPQNYYASFSVERISDTGTLATKNSVWVSGDKYRLEVTGDSNRIIICDGQNVRVINEAGDQKTFPISDEFSYAQQIGVVDLDYFLGEDENELLYTYFAQATGRSDSNLIYVEFYNPRFDQRETFYINTDCGIVVSAQTYTNEALTYRMTADEFITDYSPEQDIFRLD